MPFAWGDTVRVRLGAPTDARPGALAEVVGIRTVVNDAQVRQFAATLGTQICLIEFGDGTSVELPEPMLESFGSGAGSIG
jgi:hypothetical protein